MKITIHHDGKKNKEREPITKVKVDYLPMSDRKNIVSKVSELMNLKK